MMFIKTSVAAILLFAVCTFACGQSDILLSQQWFSRVNMNPAATGNSNYVDVFLLNRQQWIGFDGAPRTSVFNAHSYFDVIRSGIGMSLILDRLGSSRQTVNAVASYAYHLDLSPNMLLSFGLAGGVFSSSWDPRKNTFSDDAGSDPELLVDDLSRVSPDFHAGMELNYLGGCLGASITHIINPAPEHTSLDRPGREIYGYARYRMEINGSFDIAPGMMYRYGNHASLFDINVTGYYQKKYWAGLSFRPNNSFAMMLGGEYGMFRLGYSYDRSAGDVSSLAMNTHEIMLSARISKPQKGRRTPRFLE